MKRSEIIGALIDRLREIKTGSGYMTDIGQNVCEWRFEPFSTSELPAINVSDISSQVQEFMEVADTLVTVLIDVVMANEGIEKLRSAIADIKSALSKDETLGGLAISVSYLGDEIEIASHEDRILVAHVKLGILYRTERWGI